MAALTKWAGGGIRVDDAVRHGGAGARPPPPDESRSAPPRLRTPQTPPNLTSFNIEFFNTWDESRSPPPQSTDTASSCQHRRAVLNWNLCIVKSCTRGVASSRRVWCTAGAWGQGAHHTHLLEQVISVWRRRHHPDKTTPLAAHITPAGKTWMAEQNQDQS